MTIEEITRPIFLLFSAMLFSFGIFGFFYGFGRKETGLLFAASIPAIAFGGAGIISGIFLWP